MSKNIYTTLLSALLMQTSCVLAAEQHFSLPTSTYQLGNIRARDVSATAYVLTTPAPLGIHPAFLKQGLDEGISRLLSGEYTHAFQTRDGFQATPIDLKPFVHDFSYPPLFKSKPIVRGGIELPYIDPKKLGIVDLMKGYGLDISSPYDYFCKGISLRRPSEYLIPPFTRFLYEPVKITFSAEGETWGNIAPISLNPLLLDPHRIEKELLKKPLVQLNEDDIIIIFKYLTSNSILIEHNEDSIKKLKELLQDPRARDIILAVSEGAKDHIQEAVSNAWFSEPNILQVLFSNSEIVRHLGTRQDEEGNDFLLKKLMASIYLNFEQVIPIFYKSEYVFHHLLYASQNKKDSADRLFEAGLVMSFSSQTGKELEKLMHPPLIRYIEKDTEILSRVVKQSIEERNPQLTQFLIETANFSIAPNLLQEAIKIPTLWNVLSEATQQDILKKVQTLDPNFTAEQLQTNHKFLKASEHALTRHPALLEDMILYDFDLAQSYQDVLASLQETDPSHEVYRDLLAQKISLETAFIQKLKQLNPGAVPTPAWSHAEADFAYKHMYFGQGVTSLVVELAELPEHQKERLLKERLDEKTFYKKKTINSKANHNIGVTSLVSQMAPLSKVVSATTRQIEKLEAAIQTGEYPFINCSWSPVSALSADQSISIFCSVSILNNLLGREDVVLIKSAGNQGLSLSDPDLKGDPAGIVFSKLLKRLQPAQMTNLILAINVKPNNEVMSSSNTPGASSDIFRNALSAQGSQTFWLDETGTEYLPIQDGGTSSAAPVITGAAALLKSYKSHFSPVLIKACLLHSGIREFMINNDDGEPREWIYENNPTEGLNVPQHPYSFGNYGMGLLNVRSAFAFADILEVYIADLKERGIEISITHEDYEGLRQRLMKA